MGSSPRDRDRPDYLRTTTVSSILRHDESVWTVSGGGRGGTGSRNRARPEGVRKGATTEGKESRVEAEDEREVSGWSSGRTGTADQVKTMSVAETGTTKRSEGSDDATP